MKKATDININIPVLIPEELISDVNLRLIFIEESQMLETRKQLTILMNWWIALDASNFNSEFIEITI